MGVMDWARPVVREQVVEVAAGAGDPPRQSAQARLVSKLGIAGVPAPAVIDALRPTAHADVSGGQRIEVGVTIIPAAGQPFQTIITQSFLPSQLEALCPGTTIAVKYDPDDPTAALISNW
jgi:hypothetical protein